MGRLSAGAAVQVLDALSRPVARATADASGPARLVLPAGQPAGVYIVRSGGQPTPPASWKWPGFLWAGPYLWRLPCWKKMGAGVRVWGIIGLCGLLSLGRSLPARAADPWQRDPVLSRLLVKKLLTDPTGYQWAATDEGVFRYDGYELLPLARLLAPGSAAAPTGLASALCLDGVGHLWLGTDEGLFRLTLGTGALRRCGLAPAAGRAAPVYALFRHPRSGHLWVSFRDGSLLVLDPQRGDRPVGPRRALPGLAALFRPDGTAAGVWVSFVFAQHLDPLRHRTWLTFTGIARLGPTGPVQHYRRTPFMLVPVPGTAPLRLFSTSAFYELSAEGRLRQLSRWLPAGQEENLAPCFSRADSVGEWGAQRHFVRLTLRGPHAGRAVVDSLRLSDNPVQYRRNFHVFEDARGVQWCYDQVWRGIYKRRAAAVPVVQPVGLAHGLPLPSARGIARLPDGRLLVGTYGGAFVQAADSPRAPLRPLPFQRRGLNPFLVAFDALTTRTPPATTVVAEEDIGFSVLDPRTGTCALLALASAEQHRPSHFQTLGEDRRGRVWGGTDSGLFCLDLRGRLARRYQRPGAARPLPPLPVLDLAADAATDHLWLATPQGLLWLAPASGAWQRVGEGRAARPLPTADLLCVAAAGPGRAWVGTRTAGLLLVDAHRGLLQQLTLAEGLPSATVGTVLVRPDGAVWAGTYAGLVRYDPARQRLAVFGQAAGFADPELNRNSAYADSRTGELLFGGVSGLYRVAANLHGAAETGHRSPVQLLATGYAESVPGGPAGGVPLPTALAGGAAVPALRLGARPTDFVEIRLALTDLLAPDLTRYAYRLRPAAPGPAPLPAWQPTTRRLVLQGLAPGDYTLEMRAETDDGQLAANVLQVPLHVARPWWQHPLALALAALALVGLAYGLFWLQGRRARREARLRDELAANLHDEVGGLLTKISLMAEVLQQPETTPAAPAADPALHQLAARLLLNSRAAVQALRDVVWSIDSRADSVQALLDRMADHLDQTAAVAGLAHSFEADPLPQLQALRPMVRKHLYLVFKEAVTNALRHAKGATALRVSLRREGSHFVLEVTDDGQATAAPSRSGMGLRSMATRAQSLKGELATGPRADGQPGYRVRLRVRG